MSSETKSIEELRQEYERLNTIKIQVSTELKSAEKQLDELKKKAKSEFGTEDLNELKKKLDSMKADNLAKRKEYQSSLDGINRKLAEIEQEYK